MECSARDIGRGLVDLIFPPRCTACGKSLGERRSPPFCEECAADFRFLSSPLCPVCGLPYADQAGTDHPCESCLLSPPPFAAARSVGAYQGVLQELIHRCKYGREVTIGETLGEIMAGYPYPCFDIQDYSVVMPVPLHVRRLRERGFNQSLILAREIAERHKLKLDYLALQRIIPTPPQIHLGRQEREQNVRGAFDVTKPTRVAGEKIILVDDVYTTGSTAGECAHALKRSGAAAVAILTLSRALS